MCYFHIIYTDIIKNKVLWKNAFLWKLLEEPDNGFNYGINYSQLEHKAKESLGKGQPLVEG
jgi:hypothetical protein